MIDIDFRFSRTDPLLWVSALVDSFDLFATTKEDN
jgi:hypothetical protein